MSINVTITLPLPTATAIQQGDFDKSHLSQLVIDAVKALPLLGGPCFSQDAPPPAFDADDRALTPPAASTYDPEIVTVRDGYTTRATSPPIYTPNPTEYGVSAASGSAVLGESVRYPETGFSVTKFPVTVIHEGKGVHPIHVNSGMTVAELCVLVEGKTGVEVGRQRIKNGESVLEFERTLFACGIRRHVQLHLHQLSGICFLDSDLDFWVHVTGSVSEKKIPVHAKLSTTTFDLGKALFEHLVPHAPFGRRQMLFRGHAAWSDLPGNSGVRRTMGDIGVKRGCFVQFELVIFPS